MTELQSTREIVKGAETYFRLFALAEGIVLREGDVEWIAPEAGYKGPAIVYRVAMGEAAEAELNGLLPGLQSGAVPPLWVLTPLSAPQNIAALLLARGFEELTKPEHPEYGMAMELSALASAPAESPALAVRRVTTLAELALWMRIVNEALHGWELLTVERYAAWLSHGALSFYLGWLHGKPVSTAATITQGGTATLEFVSTLPEAQKQGAGYAVCLRALRDLQQERLQTVSLRSSPEGTKLYRKLGFQPFYTQRLFRYPPMEG